MTINDPQHTDVQPRSPGTPSQPASQWSEPSTSEAPRSEPSSQDPDELRRQIEHTRSDLSRNVNALGEAADPGAIAKRQAGKVGDKITGAGRRIKESIMGGGDDTPQHGSASGLGERAGDLADSARGGISDAAGSTRDAVADAPSAARRRTRGNPLAAGLIAVGVGWLAGSLLPASDKEREWAAEAKDQFAEKGQPLVDEVKTAARDTAEHLKEPAQRAVDSVTSTAREGAEHVKDEGRQAMQDTGASARDSVEAVQSSRRS